MVCSKIKRFQVQNDPILTYEKYARPIPVYNADRTQNIGGPITEKINLKITIGDHVEILSFDVTNLGETNMFIGHEWLKKHNPDINWTTKPEDDDNEEDDEIEPGDWILMIDIEHEIQIRARENVSTGIAIEAGKKEKDKSFEEIVPEHYRDFKDIFDKKEFDSLPPRRPWDHAIELIPGSKGENSAKIYPLSPSEQKELDDFLEENLKTG
ncbi:pro-pol protein [Moniliophthora roreri MCA 2997]|uniref:Pro-pol protein n=1 Tax=Moniliophthora roreri (strain MCA 2997) TaxID=1381753 RepID=V2XEB5_MONRO|nr:pro-pol protein [Moniliophthora roreri MCA 2997]